jgi:hypothetical protein
MNGQVPAETGQLIFLCGGDEVVYNHEVVGTSLDAMGKVTLSFSSCQTFNQLQPFYIIGEVLFRRSRSGLLS